MDEAPINDTLAPTTLPQPTDQEQRRLLAWINTHDCGVDPTGVLRADGAIDIRCTAVARGGEVAVETDTVHTYGQARAVLGY